MEDEEFIGEFLAESYENLEEIDTRLVALEGGQDPESLSAIFRAMHTIKGTSGFFGFGRVERLGHVAENLLGRLRDGEIEFTPDRATALLESTDGLRALFAGIAETGTEPDLDLSVLMARLETLTSDAADDAVPEPDPPTADDQTDPASAVVEQAGPHDPVAAPPIAPREAAAAPISEPVERGADSTGALLIAAGVLRL